MITGLKTQAITFTAQYKKNKYTIYYNSIDDIKIVGQTKEEINNNFASLLELDYLFAKAKYGNRLDAKRATLGNEVKLVGAKHPLIDKNKVVSNTFIMNEKTQKHNFFT